VVTLLSLTLLVAAAAGGVALVLGTEAGTRFLAKQAANLAPGVVQWSQLEGSILGPLRLRGLQLHLEGLQLSIAELSLAWQPAALLDKRVRLDRLAGQGIELLLTPVPETADSGPFDPSTFTLPVAIDLAEIAFSDLLIRPTGAETLRIENIELAAYLEGQQLDLKNLAIRLPEGGAPPLAGLGGSLKLGGSARWDERITFALDYQLVAAGLQDFEASLPPRMTIEGSVRGTQGGDELLLQAVSLAVADTPLALSLDGRLTSLGTADPGMDLSLRWAGVTWPIQVEPARVSSARGSATLKGTPADYSLEMGAELAGADIPEGSWTLAGRGDLAHFEIARLHGEVIGGELFVGGEVRWDPAPQWNLQLTGSGLDPGQLRPELPGELAVSLRTDGRLDSGGKPVADLHLGGLQGSLAGIPLRAIGHARLQGEAVELVTASVESQGNGLQASGHLSAGTLAIDWQLEARNPAALLAGAGGEISASGSVAGSPASPRVRAQLSGRRLVLDNLALDAVDGALTAGLDPGDPLELDIKGGPVTGDGQLLLTSMQLQAAGTTGQHRLGLDLDTPGARLHARLDGGPDESLTAWQGRVEELSLDSPDYGQWRLGGHPELALAAGRASLGEGCLQVTTGTGRVCVAGHWADEGESQAQVRVESLPLAMFVREIGGDIAGSLTANLAANGGLRADGALALDPGEIRVNETRKLSHGGGQLDLRVDESGLAARLQLAAPEQGTVDAQVSLPALTALPLADEQPLAGSLGAVLPDLSGLAAWIPELGRSTGRLEADLQLGGSLAQPRVEGTLALRDGAATLPLAGLELEDIQLQAASDPSRPGSLAVTGTMRSGPGQLALTGQAELEAGTVDLALAGERFEVYDTPDARALLSPDLQLAWRDNTLTLRGQVAVPQADISPQIRLGPGSGGEAVPAEAAPGQVIAPSPDVVVVSETLQVAPQDTAPVAPFRIDSRLRVVMGDKVRIKAVGLVSRIAGAVDFTNTPEQPTLIPLAKGRFSLEEGTFRAFGQDLEIETGQLIFEDVPATEPEINLRAVRWIDNDPKVTAAGVLVTGPLVEPTLEMFSRPQLDSSEIQSYLLTGRSPRSDENVLGIGTYVTRKVYVGYGFNMLERTSEFNSLFNISPRFGLGSSVGEADNNLNLTITYER
jgi:autotransporter translocation and assembly factor TamB